MKPGLLVFSPLPPLRNGIADYTARLLPFHADEFDCAVVIDDACPEPAGLPANVSVLRDTEYRRHAKELRSYRHLFHVGNNADHVYMLPHLRPAGGLVVIHDLSLHHMIREAYAEGRAKPSGFVESVWESHGYSGRVLARQDTLYGWRTNSNYIECHGRHAVIGGAGGAVTHSRLGLSRLRSEYPDLPVYHIPHFADRPTQDRAVRRDEARRQLGLTTNQKILLSLGFVTNAKQIVQVLDAVRILADSAPASFRLVVAGQENDFSVMDEARKRDVHHLVECVGYVEEEDMGLYLDAADILLNLRYPTLGETSGSLCRAFGHGVCALVSDHGWYGELPAGAVVKIPPRPDVAEVVAGNICGLFASPQTQADIEAAAQRFAAREMGLEKIASQYNAALRELRPRPETSSSGPQHQIVDLPPSLEGIKARMKLLPKRALEGRSERYFGSLWWSGGQLPLPRNGEPMAVSGPLALKYAIRKLFGCGTTRSPKKPLSCGLYVGPWEQLERNGSRMSEFSDHIAPRGLALLDIWVPHPSSGSDPCLIPLATIDELLARYGLEVLAEIRISPQLSINYERLPLQEIALLSRKRS